MQDINTPYLPPEPPEEDYSPVIPPASPSSDKQNREGLKSIITTLLILLMAPILALSITAFVFQSYEVDGPSMQSTLETNDRLIVWKFGHTLSRVTKKPYIPERGSIIVFVKRGLYDFGSNKEKQLIKRVVGIPGDRIVVDNGTITVFNSNYPNGFNYDKEMGIETTIMGETVGNVDISINEGELFVVGDHRDNSLDSRTFGTIPNGDIVGTLSARILPLSTAQKF